MEILLCIAAVAAVVLNGVFIILGTASTMKFKEAVKESLPYIGVCLCGAMTTVCFTLMLYKLL